MSFLEYFGLAFIFMCLGYYLGWVVRKSTETPPGIVDIRKGRESQDED